MKDGLLNSLAIPIPISMRASGYVLYNGRREVLQIHEVVSCLKFSHELGSHSMGRGY